MSTKKPSGPNAKEAAPSKKPAAAVAEAKAPAAAPPQNEAAVEPIRLEDLKKSLSAYLGVQVKAAQEALQRLSETQRAHRNLDTERVMAKVDEVLEKTAPGEDAKDAAPDEEREALTAAKTSYDEKKTAKQGAQEALSTARAEKRALGQLQRLEMCAQRVQATVRRLKSISGMRELVQQVNELQSSQKAVEDLKGHAAAIETADAAVRELQQKLDNLKSKETPSDAEKEELETLEGDKTKKGSIADAQEASRLLVTDRKTRQLQEARKKAAALSQTIAMRSSDLSALPRRMQAAVQAVKAFKEAVSQLKRGNGSNAVIAGWVSAMNGVWDADMIDLKVTEFPASLTTGAAEDREAVEEWLNFLEGDDAHSMVTGAQDHASRLKTLLNENEAKADISAPEAAAQQANDEETTAYQKLLAALAPVEAKIEDSSDDQGANDIEGQESTFVDHLGRIVSQWDQALAALAGKSSTAQEQWKTSVEARLVAVLKMKIMETLQPKIAKSTTREELKGLLQSVTDGKGATLLGYGSDTAEGYADDEKHFHGAVADLESRIATAREQKATELVDTPGLLIAQQVFLDTHPKRFAGGINAARSERGKVSDQFEELLSTMETLAQYFELAVRESDQVSAEKKDELKKKQEELAALGEQDVSGDLGTDGFDDDEDDDDLDDFDLDSAEAEVDALAALWSNSVRDGQMTIEEQRTQLEADISALEASTSIHERAQEELKNAHQRLVTLYCQAKSGADAVDGWSQLLHKSNLGKNASFANTRSLHAEKVSQGSEYVPDESLATDLPLSTRMQQRRLSVARLIK